MKVMCIKDVEWTKNGNWKLANPVYGDICTVVKEFYFDGKKVYLLQEFPYDGGYFAHRFIPLSDVDEMEMIREKQLQEA